MKIGAGRPGVGLSGRAMRTWRYGLCASAIGLSLAGCVTINIYFPAAAAEKAADKIIDEVWQLKEGGAPPAAKPAPGETK
jgi:hypothetical protein